MSNPNFHKIKKIGVNRYLTKVKYGYIWQNGGFKRVWSGASVVSYYDGNTLIGTEEVDEGEDVLHPSFALPQKTGYTLYGWRVNPNDLDRVETLLATGEPMTVYAYYVPNSIVVAKGSFSGTNYMKSIWNTDYVSGDASAEGNTSGQPVWFGCSFNINWRWYQNASLTVRTAKNKDGQAHYLSGSVNGVTFTAPYSTSSAQTTVTPNNGNNNLSAYLAQEYGEGWAYGAIGVLNVTLSNPIAWQ